MEPLFNLTWISVIVITLLLTHITILSVTLYLHRGVAHRAIKFHPALVWFFRTWLWFTTGMTTTQWAAVHRKHHAKCETPEDPHSPQQLGIWTVLFKGVWLYKREANNPLTVAKYAPDAPKDSMERIFTKYSWHGMLAMLILELALFGPMGLFIWVAQILWIPIWAAGVINGVGHFVGYRNFECADASRNISPWGIFIGGEELHNNHHAYPASAKLSSKPWEFDWGWAVLTMLSWLGLAQVIRVMPQLQTLDKPTITPETLSALIATRFEVIHRFRKTMTPWIKELTHEHFPKSGLVSQRTFINWFFDHDSVKNKFATDKFEQVLQKIPSLAAAKKMIEDLKSLWHQKGLSNTEAFEAFKNWCHKAETSGIEYFRTMSQHIQRRTLVA